MSDQTETRTFTVVYDNNTYPMDVTTIRAAYYRQAADGELIEFKDTEHHVVFAISARRVVSIDTKADSAVAAAEHRLRLAQRDEADALARHGEVVREAQEALAAAKAAA